MSYRYLKKNIIKTFKISKDIFLELVLLFTLSIVTYR